jgi:hypothetical protein
VGFRTFVLQTTRPADAVQLAARTERFSVAQNLGTTAERSAIMADKDRNKGGRQQDRRQQQQQQGGDRGRQMGGGTERRPQQGGGGDRS